MDLIGRMNAVIGMANNEQEKFVLMACIPKATDDHMSVCAEMKTPWEFDFVYEGSEEVTCEVCIGRAWIGPEQLKTCRMMEAMGVKYMMVCALCAVLFHEYVKSRGDRVGVHPLSDDDPNGPSVMNINV